MDANLNWIANFIWGIADDILRDLYVRGKYRDVILPMTVLRRLDALLEPTKQAVLDADVLVPVLVCDLLLSLFDAERCGEEPRARFRRPDRGCQSSQRAPHGWRRRSWSTRIARPRD